MLEHPGKAFQSKTGYSRQAMEDHELDWRSKPPEYKFYPHAPVIALPDPARGEGEQPAPRPVDLRRRQEKRPRLRPDPTHAAAAVAGPVGRQAASPVPSSRRAARTSTERRPRPEPSIPSRPTWSPTGWRTWNPASTTTGWPAWTYWSGPWSREATPWSNCAPATSASEIRRAALDQPLCAKAGAVLVWTAIFARSVWKYRERAYRYVYLDAGHIAAHVSLAAVAEGLGSCPVAALYDDEANSLLDIDGQEEGTLYMTAVGVPARPFGGAGRVDLRHTARPKE